MMISDLVINDDGSYDMKFQASSEEMQYLATFAVNNLINMGIIHLNEEAEGDQEVNFLNQKGH